MFTNTLLNKSYRQIVTDRNIYIAVGEYSAIVLSQQHNINQLGADHEKIT
jgi:hypothetical protein